MMWDKIFCKNKIVFCSLFSDKGNIRNNNEDNFLCGDAYNEESEDQYIAQYRIVLKNFWIFAVFDGMGGIEQGEVASKYAAETFASGFGKIAKIKDVPELDRIIRSLFLEANRKIVSKTVYAGTTATVLVTNGKIAKVYHLGDCRAYLSRRGDLIQLTKDQTLEAFKRELGLENEIVKGDKNKLLEYIGGDPNSEGLEPYESDIIALETGDEFLICSDGIYDVCDDRQLIQVMHNQKKDEISSYIVGMALKNGSRDNVTCMYLRFM